GCLSRCGGRGLRRAQAAFRHAALEALDAPARVDQLLTTGVERVAVGAHLDVELRTRRTRRELVAASAAHVSLHVVGMDWSLHAPPHSSVRRAAPGARTRRKTPLTPIACAGADDRALRRRRPTAKCV